MSRASSFGPLLASYRRRAARSQLDLALETGVSARHLSFLEGGRARPSERMVLRLSGTLRLAPGERDSLLVSAGFAPQRADLSSPDKPQIGFGAIGIRAFEAAVAMATATSAEQAVEIAAGALAMLGIQHFMTGTMRPGASGWHIHRDVVGRPAVGWLRHIEVNRYRNRDCLVAAAGTWSRGFFWEDVPRAPMAPEQRRILDEAAEFGIGTGFVMPIHRGNGTVRALSSWADRLDLDSATRTAASLVSTSLLEALDRLGVDALDHDAPARLSPDHRDVLSWLASGRSIAAMAEHRSRAAHDLRLLAEQAAGVMGTSCPAYAASRAVALGLVAA